MSEEKNDSDKEKVFSNADLKKAIQSNRFFDFLIETKKYKHFFYSKEAAVALIISLIITYLLGTIAKDNFSNGLKIAETLIPIFLGGMFTVLGLSLAGLAIVTSTMEQRFITTVIKENKLYSLLSIIFNFYFSGFVIGVTIIFLTISLITIKLPFEYNNDLFLTFVLINSYLNIFSIIYAVMLLGTCIRLFITKYVIEMHDE